MIMEDEEVQKIINENPNLADYLKKYIVEIKPRMTKTLVFYKKLSFDLKDEAYPNVIYPTKGSIFI